MALISSLGYPVFLLEEGGVAERFNAPVEVSSILRAGL
jgi:hypothetical protein